eukprot:9144186-Pyramimonas_sp.AAC.1
MQQEAQRIENHERALRHDLERQKLTCEQQRQEAYHLLDAIRAESASKARTAPTSEAAARQQEMSEQFHRSDEPGPPPRGAGRASHGSPGDANK